MSSSALKKGIENGQCALDLPFRLSQRLERTEPSIDVLSFHFDPTHKAFHKALADLAHPELVFVAGID